MALTSFFYRRQRSIEKQLSDYLDHWLECVECLDQGLTTYLEEGPGEQVDYYYAKVDEHESTGDKLRRAVERELYEKALLPEARGDILRVLETMDTVINRAESTIRQLVIERLEIEPWMKQEMTRMTSTTVEGCHALREAASGLLDGNEGTIPGLVAKVGEAESRCDHLEEDLLGRIFASDLDLARKLQLKDLVRRLATVSDQAEKAADMVFIVSVKRRV